MAISIVKPCYFSVPKVQSRSSHKLCGFHQFWMISAGHPPTSHSFGGKQIWQLWNLTAVDGTPSGMKLDCESCENWRNPKKTESQKQGHSWGDMSNFTKFHGAFLSALGETQWNWLHAPPDDIVLQLPASDPSLVCSHGACVTSTNWELSSQHFSAKTLIITKQNRQIRTSGFWWYEACHVWW